MNKGRIKWTLLEKRQVNLNPLEIRDSPTQYEINEKL
jgi:hypothetical protein